uniref:Uncharacterized protein n=1 Tax=Arundo donax TaxID=35708 RepID=A0A0A9GXR7_ARUDO
MIYVLALAATASVSRKPNHTTKVEFNSVALLAFCLYDIPFSIALAPAPDDRRSICLCC